MTAFVIATPAERMKALHATVTKYGAMTWMVTVIDGLGGYGPYCVIGTRRRAEAVARRHVARVRRQIRREAAAFEVR